MRKLAAVVFGALSFAPLLWVVVTEWNEELWVSALDPWIIGPATTLWLLAMLSCVKLVPHGKRSLWAVVLLLANFIALPFYWVFYVRPYLWRPTADA